MLRIDRVAIWTFIVAFALLVPSIEYLNYLDELVAVVLLLLAVADSIINRGAWRRYRLLWITLGIMLFYAVYSMTAVSYTTPMPIIIDILIESKPFIALFVMMTIRPRLTQTDMTILKCIAVINVIICAAVLPLPNRIVQTVFQHVSYGGIFIFLSTLVFIGCSIGRDGTVPAHSKVVIVILATLGLLCGRSKYYAEYVMTLFFLFAYRPGLIRRLTFKHMVMMTLVVALVVAVTWKKFSYYFLVGNTGATTFDPSVIESFARPVLYATGFLILTDHFPFGTGLASFASYRSIEPYSGVYVEYGINNVYGLSPAFPSFVCDAYYPSLAQFGIVGIGLFIWLMTWLIRNLGVLARNGRVALYSVGMLAMTFVLVESTAGTAMVNCGGVMAMLILGIVEGRANSLRDSLTSRSQTLHS